MINSGKQFNVNGAILAALENLDVSLNVDSGVKIDDCKFEFLMFDMSRSVTHSLQIPRSSPSSNTTFLQSLVIRCI